jgi:ABC-type transport system involved in cytochrome c biogenesis permease subunit
MRTFEIGGNPAKPTKRNQGMRTMKYHVFGAWLLLAAIGTLSHGAEPTKGDGFDWDIWRRMAVLDGGRPKPLDTLAWEQIYSFAGRSKFKPAAFATIGLADIKDWNALTATLASGKGESAKIAARLPKGLVERMKGTKFDTSALEAEALGTPQNRNGLDQQLEKRLEKYVSKIGVSKTMKEFRAETTDAEDKKLIARFDELVAQIDAVGKVKGELIQSLNAQLPDRSLVPEEFLKKVNADPSKLTPPEVSLAHRRYIEAALGDSIVPLTEIESPNAKGLRFADRKYDPVELALTLILTWQGWDKPEELSKLLSSKNGGGPGIVARIYWDHHQPDVWDVTPVIDARYQDIAPKLDPEIPAAVSIQTIQENPWFIRWAIRSSELLEDKSRKGDKTTADEKAVDVLKAYVSYLTLRSGQTFAIGPDQNIKPRLDHIQTKMAELASKINSLPHAKAAEELAKWRESISADQGPGAKDLLDIADRLSKEFNVQASAKTPIPVATLLEQQLRLRMDEIPVGTEWLSFLDIIADPERAAQLGYAPATVEILRKHLLEARTALLSNNPSAFNAASSALASELEKLGKQSWFYPAPSAIDTELHYNRFQPFLWTAVLSGIALIILALSLGLKSSVPYLVGVATLLAGVGFMIYGMAMRIQISGRPPVTNMYETIIWASFVMTALAIVLGMVYRKRIILLTAALTLTPATLLAYVMPPEYGSSIDPLVPVLRDNFWLIIHVLTIVASYGALMLAWMLGNVGLTYYLFGNDRPDNVKPIALYIYRCIQVGVLLLAAGTILGGWWAAYSWGRFWGWDPKEVWALIALLGYLAVLHARFAGLIKTFGLIVWSVVSFSGVLMSWYGVNFVLGEGLHAYAFGSGGQPYVFTAVVINLAYVAFVVAVHKARQQSRTQKQNSRKDDELVGGQKR